MPRSGRFPPVQAYELNKCLSALKCDADFRQRYVADAEQALREFRLTLAEREAIRRGDHTYLAALGARPHLAFVVCRCLEMEQDTRPRIDA